MGHGLKRYIETFALPFHRSSQLSWDDQYTLPHAPHHNTLSPFRPRNLASSELNMDGNLWSRESKRTFPPLSSHLRNCVPIEKTQPFAALRPGGPGQLHSSLLPWKPLSEKLSDLRITQLCMKHTQGKSRCLSPKASWQRTSFWKAFWWRRNCSCVEDPK